MPRRKQNRPKRMELGEGGDAGGELLSKEVSESNEDDDQQQSSSSQSEDEQQQPNDPSDQTSRHLNDDKDLSQDDSLSNSSAQSQKHPVTDGPPSPSPSPPPAKTSKSTKRTKVDIKLETERTDKKHGDTVDTTPLDFSVKPVKVKREPSSHESVPLSLSLTNKSQEKESVTFPLDLSVKRPSQLVRMKHEFSSKMSRRSESPPAPRILSSPQHYVRGPSTSPLTSNCNGSDKLKREQISQHSSSSHSHSKSVVSSSSLGSSRSSSSSHGRQNPWQTQWINRSSEQTRDVFTCVWCKESFRSLQEMTVHMKESPRCGMAGMQQAAANAASVSAGLASSSPASSSSTTGAHAHVAASSAHTQSPLTSARNGSTSSNTERTSGSSSGKEPMSSAVLAKNNVNLPRKLVRGQDVWLGRGAEQTRQILKCMWCGQSFKTLDDMTRHMRVTQHYTNIISQEQIISWRTPEDKLAQAQVNAVLTCKVCDEAFGSLKELSYHMVKNSHYKEHILRSITEGGHGRRRQTRERRKKSLPVRKLLELERMTEITPTASSTVTPAKEGGGKPLTPKKERDHRTTSNDKPRELTTDRALASAAAAATSIPCDECGERVEAKYFISHIKACKGAKVSSAASRKRELRSPNSSSLGSQPGSGPPSRSQTESPPSADKEADGTGDYVEANGCEKEDKSPQAGLSSSGILSAMESLIKKIDVNSKNNPTTGILQRLGIDEEVCPPWQHMAGQGFSHPFHPWSSSYGKDPSSPSPSGTSSNFANSSVGSHAGSCPPSPSPTESPPLPIKEMAVEEESEETNDSVKDARTSYLSHQLKASRGSKVRRKRHEVRSPNSNSSVGSPRGSGPPSRSQTESPPSAKKEASSGVEYVGANGSEKDGKSPPAQSSRFLSALESLIDKM